MFRRFVDSLGIGRAQATQLYTYLERHIHLDEVGHIPLHQQALAWGVSANTVNKVWQRPFTDVDLRYVIMK